MLSPEIPHRPDLPYDVWVIVIGELGAKDVARLSMVSKHFAELFDQKSLWSRVARQEASRAHLAPHSLDVHLLSIAHPKQLVARRFQVEKNIHNACQSLDAASTANPSISLTEPDLFSEFILSFSLDGDDPASVRDLKLQMLPGARWLLGSAKLESNRYSLFCWDLSSVDEPSHTPHSYERTSATPHPQLSPVADFHSSHLFELVFPKDRTFDAHFSTQFDASTATVHVFLTYMYSSTGAVRDRHVIEVIQLTWDQQTPHFHCVARYGRPAATLMEWPDRLTLDGSFVMQRIDGYLLVWNWRTNRHAWVSCNAVGSATLHRRRTFIPPYFFGRTSDVEHADTPPNCLAFVLDLENLAGVDDDSSPPPLLTFKEALIPIYHPDDVGFESRAIIGIGSFNTWTPLSQSPYPPLVRGVALELRPGLFGAEPFDVVALLRVEHDGTGRIASLRMAVLDRQAETHFEDRTSHYLPSGDVLSIPNDVGRWHPLNVRLITLNEACPRIVDLYIGMFPLEKYDPRQKAWRVRGACLFSGCILVSNVEYVPGAGVGCRLGRFPA